MGLANWYLIFKGVFHKYNEIFYNVLFPFFPSCFHFFQFLYVLLISNVFTRVRQIVWLVTSHMVLILLRCYPSEFVHSSETLWSSSSVMLVSQM